MEKCILTIQELSTYTGWSKSWIYKKTSDGTLQFSKPLGKTIFFSKEWIDNFLMSAMNVTSNELEIKATTFVHLNKGKRS